MPDPSLIRIHIEFFGEESPVSNVVYKRLEHLADYRADITAYYVGEEWFEFRDRTLKVVPLPAIFIDDKRVPCLQPGSMLIDDKALQTAIRDAQQSRANSAKADAAKAQPGHGERYPYPLTGSRNYKPKPNMTEARHEHLTALEAGRWSRYSYSKIASDCRKLGWAEFGYDQDTDPPTLLGEIITDAGKAALTHDETGGYPPLSPALRALIRVLAKQAVRKQISRDKGQVHALGGRPASSRDG